jgi:dihydroxy-acid dehydratase
VSHGAIGVHCAPEAAVGGPLARVRDGDAIAFDLLRGEIRWQGNGQDPGVVASPPAGEIYLQEFIENVTQANFGCVSRQVLVKQGRVRQASVC